MEDINNVFVNADEPEVDYAELDMDDQLKYTQRIKGKVLHKLISGNDGVPTDKESVELLLKVADSMDKTTIAKKRLQVDEKRGDDAVSILNAIAQSIAAGDGRSPFLLKEGAAPVAHQDLGELPDFGDKHAKGEDEIGVIIETSDKFINRMDIVNKELMEQRSKEMGIA